MTQVWCLVLGTHPLCETFRNPTTFGRNTKGFSRHFLFLGFAPHLSLRSRELFFCSVRILKLADSQ